jgi:hypothetical protein
MISTTTLGTAVNSVTIGSIPSTYTDLRLIYNAINITSQDSVLITFNGDTSSNYSSTILGGNGSAAGSERRSSVPYIIVTNNYVTLVNGNGLFDFMNYSNSTTNKTVLMRSGNAADSTVASVGLWRSTSAITSINLRNGGAFTFGIGSMFTLYGIKAE